MRFKETITAYQVTAVVELMTMTVSLLTAEVKLMTMTVYVMAVVDMLTVTVYLIANIVDNGDSDCVSSNSSSRNKE
jgi:hypothetical protein